MIKCEQRKKRKRNKKHRRGTKKRKNKAFVLVCGSNRERKRFNLDIALYK